MIEHNLNAKRQVMKDIQTGVRSYCYGNEVRILFTDNVKYGIWKQGKLIHCVDSDIIHRKKPNILLNFIPINNNKTRTL